MVLVVEGEGEEQEEKQFWSFNGGSFNKKIEKNKQ